MAHRPRRYQGKPRRRRRFEPPFEVMQPLERYRLHHGMYLDAFVEYLGITEEVYVGLIAIDDTIALGIKEQIARRLRVPRFLITECLMPLPEKIAADLEASLAAIKDDDGTYYIRDENTGEFLGPFYEEREVLPPERDVPLYEQRLADAVSQFHSVHQDRQDPDYPRVQALLEQRVRAYLNLRPNEVFDAESWAEETFMASLPRVRRVGAERDAQDDA
jgi:hypothetical protein